MQDFIKNSVDQQSLIMSLSKNLGEFLEIDSLDDISQLLAIEVESLGFVSPIAQMRIRRVLSEMGDELSQALYPKAALLNDDLIDKLLDIDGLSSSLKRKYSVKLKMIFREIKNIYRISISFELEDIIFDKFFDKRTLKESALCMLTGVSIITPREEIHVTSRDDRLDFHWAIMLQVFKKIFNLETASDNIEKLSGEFDEILPGSDKNFIRIRYVVNVECNEAYIWLPLYITPFQLEALSKLDAVFKRNRVLPHIELTNYDPITSTFDEKSEVLNLSDISISLDYLSRNNRIVDYDIEIPVSYYDEEKKPNI